MLKNSTLYNVIKELKTCQMSIDLILAQYASTILYSRKFWRIVQFSVIHNLKPSKLVLIINHLLANLLIRLTFFCQLLKKSQFAKFSHAKLSHYTLISSLLVYCLHPLLWRPNLIKDTLMLKKSPALCSKI